jgi:hypothetical protein
MEQLRQRGVEFEEYDLGEMKTENGLLDVPGMGKPGSSIARGTPSS